MVPLTPNAFIVDDNEDIISLLRDVYRHLLAHMLRVWRKTPHISGMSFASLYLSEPPMADGHRAHTTMS